MDCSCGPSKGARWLKGLYLLHLSYLISSTLQPGGEAAFERIGQESRFDGN